MCGAAGGLKRNLILSYFIMSLSNSTFFSSSSTIFSIALKMVPLSENIFLGSVPCSVPDGPARFLLSSRCPAAHCALRLAQTNVSPGFTLMLDVRDVHAIPNELRAAMVTWLPVICAVSCLACS